MKKALFLFVLAVVFMSCEDSVPQELTTKQIFELTVNKSNWVEYTDGDGLNRYYSCYFPLRQINSSLLTDGAVVAYTEINDKQQILPYVRHYEDTKGYVWTRTVDYDFSNGGITFYVTNSDFAKYLPETMYFRVVLMW
jgi:hypothetical protein